jgi:hypothetical protein
VAHRLICTGICGLRHLNIEGGAKVAHVEAGAEQSASHVPVTRRNPLRHPASKVAQRWRKVAQQRGRRATRREPLKGFPCRDVAQAPGPFAVVALTLNRGAHAGRWLTFAGVK